MEPDYEVDCPRCKEEVGVAYWIDGECMKCGLEYWWEEYCTEDYSDCWAEAVFDTWDKKLYETDLESEKMS